MNNKSNSENNNTNNNNKMLCASLAPKLTEKLKLGQFCVDDPYTLKCCIHIYTNACTYIIHVYIHVYMYVCMYKRNKNASIFIITNTNKSI